MVKFSYLVGIFFLPWCIMCTSVAPVHDNGGLEHQEEKPNGMVNMQTCLKNDQSSDVMAWALPIFSTPISGAPFAGMTS